MNQDQHQRQCLVRLPVFLFGFFPLVAALAQTAEQPGAMYPAIEVKDTALQYRQFEKVEITGSSIVRKQQTQALPVQVITRSDIKNSGVKGVPELIQNLPVMFGFSEPGQLGLARAGFSSSAIHGMAARTLVLINGKRQAIYGRQNISGEDRSIVDLDMLPLGAVERVEILTDGASSLYGTDAIAGVVNIITRNERQGIEVSTNVRLPDGMKGQSKAMELSWGQGSLNRDGYSWFASLGVENQAQLMGADRPYVSEGRQYFGHQGRSYFVDGSSLTAFQSGSPTLGAGLGSTYGGRLWNAQYQDGRCPDRQVPAVGQPACLYNPYPEFGLYPQTDSKRFYGKGSYYVDASRVVYAELAYSEKSQYKNYSMWQTSYGVIGSSPSSPGYALATANGFVPGQTYLMYRPTELGTRARQYDDNNQRVAVGIKGEINEWNYNASLYQAESESSLSIDYAVYGNSGILTNDSRFSSVYSSNPATQDLYNIFISRKKYQKIENGRAQIQALDFSASKTLFEIDGDPVLLGTGFEWRRQRDRFEGNYVGTLGGQPDFDAQRHVFAQYIEVQWPVAPKFEVITALRNDHYSDFGNTTHGKISTKWLVNDAWMLRGSWGTGFRAPTVAQIQKTEIFPTSFLSMSCNAQLSQLAAQLSPQAKCANDGRIPIFTTGSDGLKPELSTQFNWGFQFKPSAQHVWSLDYWRVNMKNTLRQYPAALVMSDPLKYSQYFVLDGNNNLSINLPTVNLGSSSIAGIDFSWAYRQPTEWGRFHTQVQGTRFLKSAQMITPEAGQTSDLGAYSTDSASVTPVMRTQWTLGLLSGDWGSQVTVNHVTGYKDDDIDARDALTLEPVTVKGRRVPAFWTLDWNTTYQVAPKMVMEAKVMNLLNKRAPLSFVQRSSVLNSFNTTYSNFWGRVVQLSLHLKF